MGLTVGTTLLEPHNFQWLSNGVWLPQIGVTMLP